MKSFTLSVENADEYFVEVVKALLKMRPNMKITLKEERENHLTINGYTKEFEREIIEDLQEIEKERKNGTLKTYKSVEEAFRQEGII